MRVGRCVDREEKQKLFRLSKRLRLDLGVTSAYAQLRIKVIGVLFVF